MTAFPQVATSQEQQLMAILHGSSLWSAVLDRAGRAKLDDWAVGAGALAQTVWNHLHGFPDRHGLRDIDIVYFDGDDLSEEAEAAVIAGMTRLYGDLGVELDVKNQARVHLWYERRFGRAIPPYRSLESSIATWPTTSTAVALAPAVHASIRIIAPFGLDDLLSGIVRPNKRQITEDIYLAKIIRWRSIWPKLDVRPWRELGATSSARS
jgi:uncharacterized protein